MPLDGTRGMRRRVAASRTPSARELVERDPERLTQEFSKADRGGRILSTPAATATARPSPRPTPCGRRPGAPVSAPCTWDELERGDVAPAHLHAATMAERLAALGDLWAGMRGQSLHEPIERLQRLR